MSFTVPPDDLQKIVVYRGGPSRGSRWKAAAITGALLLVVGSPILGYRLRNKTAESPVPAKQAPVSPTPPNSAAAEEASLLHFVEASQIGRMELLVQQPDPGFVTPKQPFVLKLRLFDRAGVPSSSEGTVTVTFYPPESVVGELRSVTIHGGEARLEKLGDGGPPVPVYEVSEYSIDRNRLGSAESIAVEVSFNDAVDASTHYGVLPLTATESPE